MIENWSYKEVHMYNIQFGEGPIEASSSESDWAFLRNGVKPFGGVHLNGFKALSVYTGDFLFLSLTLMGGC